MDNKLIHLILNKRILLIINHAIHNFYCLQSAILFSLLSKIWVPIVDDLLSEYLTYCSIITLAIFDCSFYFESRHIKFKGMHWFNWRFNAYLCYLMPFSNAIFSLRFQFNSIFFIILSYSKFNILATRCKDLTLGTNGLKLHQFN